MHFLYDYIRAALLGKGVTNLLGLLVVNHERFHPFPVRPHFFQFLLDILQMLIDPYIISVPQLLCDYIFAFGALGLSGLFADKKHGLTRGYVTGIIGRFVFSFLSGYIFFGMYAPEGMNPAAYSAIYNGSYIFTEGVLTLFILMIPAVYNAVKRVKALARLEEYKASEKA